MKSTRKALRKMGNLRLHQKYKERSGPSTTKSHQNVEFIGCTARDGVERVIDGLIGGHCTRMKWNGLGAVRRVGGMGFSVGSIVETLRGIRR